MSAFVSFYDKNDREWQIHTVNDDHGQVKLNEKCQYFEGNHLIKDECFPDKSGQLHLKGWIIIVDGVFKGVELTARLKANYWLEDWEESELDHKMIREKYGIHSAKLWQGSHYCGEITF